MPKNPTKLPCLILTIVVAIEIGLLLIVLGLNLCWQSPPIQPQIFAGVVPHHILAGQIIEKFYTTIAVNANPQNIILISPDHFNSAALIGKNKFITTVNGFANFNTATLTDSPHFAINNSAVMLDHGITVHLPLIKKYFPQAHLTPILIPTNIDQKQINNLVASINQNLLGQTLIIASVDFSHYVNKQIAERQDVTSLKIILDSQQNNFVDIKADCWQCLSTAKLFATTNRATKTQILDHTNSAEILNMSHMDNVTSYFSLIFKK